MSLTPSSLHFPSFGFSDSEPVSPTRSNAEHSNSMSVCSDGRMDKEREEDFNFAALDDYLSEMVGKI